MSLLKSLLGWVVQYFKPYLILFQFDLVLLYHQDIRQKRLFMFISSAIAKYCCCEGNDNMRVHVYSRGLWLPSRMYKSGIALD